MKFYPRPILVLVYLASFSLLPAQDILFPLGFKAPNQHHVGDVWLYLASRADSVFDYNMAVATSAPGAYLNWHLHPGGQQLIVTEGEGYYQERGQPVMVMRKGDLIKCAPGVEHWHGATPSSGVTYLAIYGGPPTEWLEPVPAEEYALIPESDPTGYTEEYLLALSRRKWRQMADKDIDALGELFHESAKFVHMGATMTKNEELSVIASGRIHYKLAEVHESSVEVLGSSAILLSRITLLAVVGGNEVTNPFSVTELYLRGEDGAWKLANMAFTKLVSTDR